MMYDKVKAEVQRAVAAMRQRATTGRAGPGEILALAVLEHEEPYREGEPWALDAPTAAISADVHEHRLDGGCADYLRIRAGRRERRRGQETLRGA